MKTAWTVLLIGFACLPGAMAAAQAPPKDVILGVKQDLLFKQLGVHRLREYPVEAGQFGCSYDLSGFQMTIAVNPDAESTAYSMRLMTAIFQIGPNMADNSIGDEVYSWLKEQGGGSVVLRVRNVTLRFNWSRSREEGLAFAKRLAEILEKDDSVAPKGQFNPKPEIVSTGLPKRLVADDRRSIVPEVRGMGDPAAVRFKIGSDGNFTIGHDIHSPKGRGRVAILISKNEERNVPEGEPLEVTIFAANEDNVFVWKTVKMDLGADGAVKAQRDIPLPVGESPFKMKSNTK